MDLDKRMADYQAFLQKVEAMEGRYGRRSRAEDGPSGPGPGEIPPGTHPEDGRFHPKCHGTDDRVGEK